MPETRESRHKQWLRVAGDKVVLKEEKEFAISGKQKNSVREETHVVSGTTVMNVQNRHQKPLHPLCHQHEEVEVRRGKRTSEAGVHLESSIDSCAKTSWKVFALNQPCDYWHPPECEFYESESGCKFVDKCSFPQWEVQEQPNKRPKKGGDNSAVALLKDVRQLGCVFQDVEPPETSAI